MRPGLFGNRNTPALFTDFTYDNLGVARNPDSRFYTLGSAFNPAGMDFVDLGLGGRTDLGTDPRAEDGKFKVPSLRNVAITGPFMHNGYFRDLKAFVQFYNDRDLRPFRDCPMVAAQPPPIRRPRAQGCDPRVG